MLPELTVVFVFFVILFVVMYALGGINPRRRVLIEIYPDYLHIHEDDEGRTRSYKIANMSDNFYEIAFDYQRLGFHVESITKGGDAR